MHLVPLSSWAVDQDLNFLMGTLSVLHLKLQAAHMSMRLQSHHTGIGIVAIEV